MADPIHPGGTPTAFALPPLPRTASGAPRRVGVEIEFMGISARAAAEALRLGLGGTMVELDPHAFLVQGTRLGDLEVELDIRYVHPQEHGATLPIHLGPTMAAWVGSALRGVVPRELITGPLPMARLAEIDEAVDLLRRAGARGRGTTWFGSLGLHFNVDPPQLDAVTLTSALKAFVLLEPWLRRETAGAQTGRRAFLAAPYPAAYARRILDPGYWPDLTSLTDDYLAANPTRDRGLDLLPVLLHIDEARVRKKLPYEKIGGRPVLHYRLPQAHVATPGWSIAPEWNRWVAVERLAADPDRLAALGRDYLASGGAEPVRLGNVPV
jgi:hypothetical protein